MPCPLSPFAPRKDVLTRSERRHRGFAAYANLGYNSARLLDALKQTPCRVVEFSMSEMRLISRNPADRELVTITARQAAAPDVAPPRGILGRVGYGLGVMIETPFGIAVLIGGLAVLATIPVLQFLSLGYLLEAGGRVARTGRLRDGFIGIRKAARVGTIVAATWLLLLPLRLVSSLSTAARLIDPDGPVARRWKWRWGSSPWCWACTWSSPVRAVGNCGISSGRSACPSGCGAGCAAAAITRKHVTLCGLS